MVVINLVEGGHLKKCLGSPVLNNFIKPYYCSVKKKVINKLLLKKNLSVLISIDNTGALERTFKICQKIFGNNYILHKNVELKLFNCL